MKKKYILFVSTIVISSCSHSKVKIAEKNWQPSSEYVYEPITRKFSCKINGKLFNPDWQTLAMDPKNADIMFATKNSQPYILIMGLELKPEYSEQVTIGGINFNKVGRYSFKNDKLVAEYIYRKHKSPEFLVSSTNKETYVDGAFDVTKFDTINKRYEGKFSFVLFNEKISKDTIKVTDGDFYLKLKID